MDRTDHLWSQIDPAAKKQVNKVHEIKIEAPKLTERLKTAGAFAKIGLSVLVTGKAKLQFKTHDLSRKPTCSNTC